MTAGAIAQLREQYLAGGQAAVKSRPADERDDELARPHGVRARHYLEHGTWMTKQEAKR